LSLNLAACVRRCRWRHRGGQVLNRPGRQGQFPAVGVPLRH